MRPFLTFSLNTGYSGTIIIFVMLLRGMGVNPLRIKPKAWGPRIQGFEGSSEKTIQAFA